MKNKLTPNQENIIKILTNEFQRINNIEESEEFDLIDVVELRSAFTAKTNRRLEVQAINTSKKEMLVEQVKVDTKRLNKDLLKLGMMATHEIHSTDGRYHLYIKNHNSSLFLRYSILYTHDSVADCMSAYNYQITYGNSVFKNIEEALKSFSIKAELKRMYEGMMFRKNNVG